MQEESIASIEQQIADQSQKLMTLRAQAPGTQVPNYEFATTEGTVNMLDLFGDHDHLLVIHNMGTFCAYCTLWADGINAFVPHLESRVGLVLVSYRPLINSVTLPMTGAGACGWRAMVEVRTCWSKSTRRE